MLETTQATAGQLDTRPFAPPRHAQILSVGTELPAGRITNEELAEKLGVSEQWILSRTGIRERCQAGPEERLSDYATSAARKALRRAGVAPDQVDLVLVATTTPDELQPNAAPIVAYELGTEGAGAFDIGSGCTGFLSAVAMAAGQIETGRADRVVVAGADFITRINNYDDRRIGPLFADGAGAVVLGEAREGVVGPIVLGSDGSHARTILVTHEERKIHMDGPEVFRHAVNRMSEVTIKALERSDLKLEEIDLFVYHQANARITRALGERLGLAAERVVDCIEEVGNTSTATIPIALETAIEDGRLVPGSNVLLAAFGSGFTWGAGAVRWGAETRGRDE